MIHINNLTGKTTKIVEMRDNHLVSTISLLLNRMESDSQKNEKKFRYERFKNIENDLELISSYITIALAKGLWNLSHTIKLELIVHRYEKQNRQFLEESQHVSTVQESDLF